jgi:HlyD family secretion protein
MKYKTWFFAAAAVLATGFVLVWAFSPRPVDVEVAPVTQGRFEATVDEDGKTRLLDRYVVSAPLTGRLARITLHEGDPVAVNAVVALLAPALPTMLDDRTMRELQARVEGAEAGVLRGITRVERAKVALEQAGNEVRRSEQLAQQGFVAPTKVENDRLAALATRREVEAADAERHVSTHDLEQARAALTAVRQPTSSTAQRSFAVRSPVAGQVLRVLQASEATVTLGAPLVELGDTGRLEIVAELLTSDALAAQPGSRVWIERWGGRSDLEGRVVRVEPAAFTKVSALGVEEQRVRVLIEITSPHDKWQALGDGFRVGVRIVTLAQDSAVQVPVGAVFPLPADAASDGNGSDTVPPRYAVFVIDEGRARRLPVVVGSRNVRVAWVQSGLKPGQNVIIYPPVGLADGKTVRIRKP